MQALLLGSIIGGGYFLSKTGKNSRKSSISNNVFKDPSQNSIYSSTYSNTVSDIEKKTADDSIRKSQNPIDTNRIPRNFNSKLVNDKTNNLKYIETTDNNNNHDNTYVSELTGETVDKETFKNMPFFGSHIRQSSVGDNNDIVNNHTGNTSFSKSKKTPTPLFEPTKDKNLQYGTQNKNDDMQERFVPSRYRKNELPFEQVKVGPGMNSDDLSAPSGGFHQDVRDYVIPKSIDDLRPKSNPQISYTGRVVPGKSISDKSQSRPNMTKNRPDTFYLNNPDRYFTTSTNVQKEAQRPVQVVKDTNRKDSKYYSGSAGPALVKNSTKRSLYKKSTKNNFKTDGPRNAHKSGAKIEENTKDSYNLPANQRDITGKRSHTSNITTIVKSLIAPITDVMKPTKKENVEGNARQTGNIGTSGVNKNVAWDPNDVTKTTIKETNIHDTRTGNIISNEKGAAWDPDDIARTTIKETNIHDTRTGNIASNEKGAAWDPNDTTRTTIKETNIHDTRTGNINLNERGTVLDHEDMKFRTTIRETISPEEINMNMKVHSKLSVKDPNDVAKTTIKETNIHDSRTGNLGGPIKLTVYDPNDVAKTTIKETMVDNKHTGNVGGVSNGNGYLTNEVEAPNTNRQFTSDNEYSGIADSERLGLGYLTNEKEAPNTNRQFTSDKEYSGTANSFYKKPSSYDHKNTMRINEVKEGTLKGRAPVPESTKIASGTDKINMEVKKIEGDIINTREVAGTKVYNSLTNIDPVSVTQEKNNYDYKIMDERIEPELLNAFKNNPYTQSLSSYAYN
tara:strand:- start:1169 stop:3538 length:2370 start_codon:yes stop_codon:yes gene_type:complete